MGQSKRVLVERCTKCYTSPKAYKMEQSQSMLKLLSEYQIAFKQWPNQPVRPSLKPENNKENREKKEKENRERIKMQMEKKSMYGLDYVPLLNPKKVVAKKQKSELSRPNGKMDASTTYELDFLKKVPEPPSKCTIKKKCINGKTNPMQPDKNTPFHGDTIYMVSYPVYNKETMSNCRQRPVKTKDNIEIPTSTESEKNAKSTAMDDFVRHESYARPMDIRPQENNIRPTEPLQGSTEYKDSYIIQTEPKTCKKKVCKEECAVSTAMTDFTWPTGFEQQKPCRPPISNHFTSAKFDGTSTSNTAYRPWKVEPYELPKWAKKYKYKRPQGIMNLTTLYMYDFIDPKMDNRPKPIRPKSDSGNPIIEDNKDITPNGAGGSTYTTDFKKWEGLHPPDSYRTLEVYTPPKENMNFETNHRSHFKGDHAPKRTLCRHASEHRNLNKDTTDTSFITTYNENYLHPRPKSCHSGRTSLCPDKSRCSSAGTSAKIPVPFPQETDNVNASAESSGQDKTTNILKIHHPSTPIQVGNKTAHQGRSKGREKDGEVLLNEE